MPTYRVAFNGKWQGEFEDQADALQWAREVGETGRIVHVASFSGGRLMRWIKTPKLVAVFPETRAEEGRRLWKIRHVGSWAGGGSGAN